MQDIYNLTRCDDAALKKSREPIVVVTVPKPTTGNQQLGSLKRKRLNDLQGVSVPTKVTPRYPLRSNVSGKVKASCKSGNQFAALALMVVHDDEGDIIDRPLQQVTHLAPEPQTRHQAMSGAEH